MKRISYFSLLLSLLLGLAFLFLSACNKVNVALAQNGKIVLYPNYGDRIVWANGLQVHFLVPLCKETDLWITQCQVNVKAQPGQLGQYNYICKGGVCADPEVDVGKSTGRPPIVPMRARVREPQPDFQVALPCDGGTIKPAPSDVPGDIYTQPVVPGKVVQWLSNGIGSVLLSDWAVTFDAGNSNVCNESDIHNADGYRSCTIKQGLAAGTYRYTAASGHCQSGNGTVTLR